MEERAKLENWPCYMCLHRGRVGRGVNLNRFCKKCRKEDARSRPSEFRLDKKL